MLLVLYLVRIAAEPASLVALLATAAAGGLVYLAGYWFWGASELERQTYRGMVSSAFRLAQTRLRRSE
jgi:hypothetical protein